ncbi:hypothetical protein GGH92_000170 [Coemansia sp. RSA 2673]|nr:hypothetical protein GGH92_000170 [Coemansia sp. RSA 2673]
MSEYYNNTFEIGFDEDQRSGRDDLKSLCFMPISDDGYLTTAAGNRVVVNRSLQRDSYIPIVTEDGAYGPFGFYVEIRKKTRTMSNRLLFKHNSKDFKQMTLAALMGTYEISESDVTRWAAKGETEWILRNEMSSDKSGSLLNRHQYRCNLKLKSTARLHNIDIGAFGFERGYFFNQELSKFICFCLESLFSELDDRDHIKNKIVRQRLFYLEPEMSFEKKVMIMERFSEGIKSMGDFYYNNVSDRNQVDVWSSSRKLILSREQYVEFSARTLHYSFKKFICPVETPHDIHAGLHVSLACLAVVAPPPLILSQRRMEGLVLSLLSSSSKRAESLFYNGYYVGKTCRDMTSILQLAKELDEFSSVYFRRRPSSVRGIYISNYGGRILRWVMNDGEFKHGSFVCPNMDVSEGEATDANFFLGFAASLVPLIHHNAGPRGVFMANMMKQTLDPVRDGEVMMSNGRRWKRHDDAILLTLTSKALGREKYGMNLLVKWASYRGLNIEDGIVINRRLMDSEDGVVYNKFSTDIGAHEYLLPISNNWNDSDNNLNDYDSDGVIREGASVDNKQTLAAKLRIEGKAFIKKTALKALIDNRSTVSKVIKSKDYLSVMTSYPYRLRIGDKMVSSAAQKGVISYVLDEEDEAADIIINPCCIPSRMTLAQIWEGVISNYHRDNKLDKPLFFPPFSNSVELFRKIVGLSRGVSDPCLDDLIPKGKNDYWYCLNRYYVLGHRVDEKFRVRGEGNKDNTNLYTSQPQRGRKVGGGLRIGVMERDVLISHNSLGTLKFLFSKHGDEVECFYCSTCLSYCQNKRCYLCNLDCWPVQVNKSEINFKNFVKVAGINIKKESEEELLETGAESPVYRPGTPS